MASDPAAGDFDPTRLIETHQAGVWRYLRVLGCDLALADDLTQETFLHVLQRPFRDYDPAATANYLRRTAYNLLVSLRRRGAKVVATDQMDRLDVEWTQWAGDDEGEELLQALRNCLGKLGERPRAALELRFREKRSRTEIAAAMALSEDGAKNMLQRAKVRLRECIEKTLAK